MLERLAYATPNLEYEAFDVRVEELLDGEARLWLTPLRDGSIKITIGTGEDFGWVELFGPLLKEWRECGRMFLEAADSVEKMIPDWALERIAKQPAEAGSAAK
jgi:hypothetical protein